MTKQSPNAVVRQAAELPADLANLTDEMLDQALAYYRVSTSEQANTSYDDEGFSIQAQREYCVRKADSLPAQIVKEFIDKGKSARTSDRPELQAMLKRVASDPDIKYVIVHKLDRLARNREDDVQIGVFLAKHGVRLVSATENIDETPGGKLVHGIMATIAEFYSGNLSQEARKGLRKKVEIGGTPGKAPLGYKNIRDKRRGKDIGLVVVDPVMGPIVAEAFRLYATGEYTLGTLTDELNHQGLRLPETISLPERPVHIQHVHRILHNAYYMGVITYSGVRYEGEHDKLVDEDTFDLVQAILAARNLNKGKSKKHPHPLKGNLYCAGCGRRMGISAPTNRYGVTYPYFYCLGRQKDTASCDQPYVSVAELEQAVADYFRRIRVPETRLRALRDESLAAFAGKHADGEAEIARAQARILRLKQRSKKNKEAYFADALSLEDFKLEQDRVSGEIASAEKTIAKLTVTLDSIERSLDQALSVFIDPYKLFTEAPDGLKLLLVQAVFEKLWVMGREVVGSELTDTFHELLTAEAKLTLDAQERAAETAADALGLDREAPTFYRHRVALSGGEEDEGDLASLVGRLWVERPRGALPLDRKNPVPPVVEPGSNVQPLVGMAGFEPAAPRSQSGCATKLRHIPGPAFPIKCTRRATGLLLWCAHGAHAGRREVAERWIPTVREGGVVVVRIRWRKNLEIARETTDSRRIALGCLHAAKPALPDKALVLLDEAEQRFLALQHREVVNLAKIATWRGRKLFEIGRVSEAETELRRAADLMMKEGRPFDRAVALESLAEVAIVRGNIDQARLCLQEAYMIYDTRGHFRDAERVSNKIDKLF